MGSTSIRITDDSTRAEVAEAMVFINQGTKRSAPVIGTSDDPTAWDRRHMLLDAMLTDWESRPL
jgi:hypothetical protein